MTEKKKNVAHTTFLKRLLMASVVYGFFVTLMLVITVEQQRKINVPPTETPDQFALTATRMVMQLTATTIDEVYLPTPEPVATLSVGCSK